MKRELLLGLLGLSLLTACGGTGGAATPTAEATETPAASAERGEALFRNKGCITCHANGRLEGPESPIQMGPDLTNYTNDPGFLRRWLANPAAVRPGTGMPDLNLSSAEIEHLIAFLNQPR